MGERELGSVDPAERRKRARCAIGGRVPFQLVSRRNEPLTFFPVDVCEEGIGVIFDLEVEAGQILRLVFPGDEPVELAVQVVWVTQPYQALGVFRAGLWEITGKSNVKELLAASPNVILDDMS